MLAISSVTASTADHATMLRQLDQVCSRAGLRRLSDLRHVDYWHSKLTGNAGCKAQMFLRVEDRRADYSVEFLREQGELKLWALRAPDSILVEMHSDWRDFKGLGYDTLKDRPARAFALAAAKRLNEHLHWHWFSAPSMQKVGRNIWVTFETISPEQKKEPEALLRYVDPYVTFIVSPQGTVISAFFGN